jgi:hypothetical protein
MNNITAERAREMLNYDPETGSVTRRVTVRKAVAGTEAGFIDRSTGYRRIKIDSRRYPAHRLIWLLVTGAWPEAEIDHINGDRADNRFCNLREATSAQNNANACMYANNKSGFKGVSWHKTSRKWVAIIRLNGKRCNLGYYDTRERAFIAYIFAAWRLFGDFAKIDADYIRAVRKRKERKELETRILRNLACPDPNYMAA